jgi:hypothetical protein
VVLLGSSSKAADRPDHPMRLVVVKIRPHVSGGKYNGGSSGVDSDGFLRIATNLLDVPAEIIALLYAYRWTIEIFFRQFKHLLGCRHLLSHNQNGITIQTYCAIIACLVIARWTGRKPTKRTHEMVCFHMTGWATTEEIEAHLAKLKLADAKPAKKVGFDRHTRLRLSQSEPLNAARDSNRKHPSDAAEPSRAAIHESDTSCRRV